MFYSKVLKFNFSILSILSISLWGKEVIDRDGLKRFEKLSSMQPKPFVIVEASGKKIKNRGQGVVISKDGHVLSAAHIAWIGEDGNYSEDFRISFRGNGKNLPQGQVYLHSTTFSDREDALFKENYYRGNLLRLSGSRFINGRDVALFKMKSAGNKSFPFIDFYSVEKPTIKKGETFHLCHYNFPHKPADPFFLINPVEVVGVAQTSSGVQYLARGYYRVGSSGGDFKRWKIDRYTKLRLHSECEGCGRNSIRVNFLPCSLGKSDKEFAQLSGINMLKLQYFKL